MPCSVVVYRDAEMRSPPYELTFSFKDVLYVVLSVLGRCQNMAHGGFARVGRGYTVSVANPREGMGWSNAIV